MNYLVAVSGGVDSVVLLDILSKTKHHLIVAHIDHGIRPESADDARFVEGLAKRYRLPFLSIRLELGPNASEERARHARYEFLFAEAQKYHATVVTAHHQNDLVETVALNLERGTGWRGLAVLNRDGIYRPLIGVSKKQIYHYALMHHLEWVEDRTNHSMVYQRNRLRVKIQRLLDQRTIEDVVRLRLEQLQLKKAIELEASRVSVARHGSRYFLSQLDLLTARELLGWQVHQKGHPRPTRPQLDRALHAIKTAQAGSRHEIGGGVVLVFTARNYQIEMV